MDSWLFSSLGYNLLLSIYFIGQIVSDLPTGNYYMLPLCLFNMPPKFSTCSHTLWDSKYSRLTLHFSCPCKQWLLCTRQ